MVAEEPQQFTFVVHAKAEVTLIVEATTPHKALQQWFALADKWSGKQGAFMDDLEELYNYLSVNLCSGPPENYVCDQFVNHPGTVVVTDLDDRTIFLVADNQKWVPGCGPENQS
jgi:hypothetical protein